MENRITDIGPQALMNRVLSTGYQEQQGQVARITKSLQPGVLSSMLLKVETKSIQSESAAARLMSVSHIREIMRNC